MSKPFYLQKIHDEYQSRLHRNSSYSLRAFAKYLGLSISSISEIMNQKRSIPRKKIDSIADKLGLEFDEKKKFLESSQTGLTPLGLLADRKLKFEDQIRVDEERHYKIIAEWEYAAVFVLLGGSSAWTKPEQIAERLSIPLARAKHVLDELVVKKIVTRNEFGSYRKLSKDLISTKDVDSSALRKAHVEMLEIGKQKIESVERKNRFFSGTTVLTTPEKMSVLRELYREFQIKIMNFLEEDGGTEVYHVGFQAFPLSELKDSESKNENLEK